ncbi:BppU family phage baseplate upper protein [Bacillus cereus group sp. BcHK10]|uniref:BppU family phage baseplate upper protein n=1 Tax=Bacillus cereus group sp. BcHK10 TaxID=3018096 RepID=UPI0022DF04D6|nr:BppU family phage baseplate upper protein [Bacillus cereus group sp. BcHK10]MDA1958509.1 BppU family phage baseplate upper protein [Bacillus cereus group sp. BcHK10]
MTFKTYEINVDLVNDTSTTYSNRFSQNDRNSAKLLVTITNKGAEIDLSQAKSVRMSFKKPDGTRVFQNDCQPINAMKGKYQIVLKTQTLTSVGTVIAQIHIEEEDRIIDTQKFFFIVNDSLASDEAVESTNEFPVIQKAIEAGKKLEGVDINGIIAAGELAQGALSKTGGMMTGPLELNSNSLLRFKGETGKRDWLFYRNSAQDSFIIAPRLADGSDWDWNKQIEFRPDNFIVNGGTNLVKKTGGTMDGWLRFLNNQELQFHTREGKSIVAQAIDGDGNYFAWNSPANKYLWFVNGKTGETVVQADNLLSKGGGTMAGQITNTNNDPMSFRPAGDNPWWLVNTSQGTLKFIPSTTNGQADWNWGKAVWISKDGLIRQGADTDWTTVTADVAVQALSGGIQAKRSGNVVNLTIGVKALQALSAKTIATLPATFHPQKTINQTYISEQGTANNVWVTSAGAIAIHMPINHSAYINLTYVI